MLSGSGAGAGACGAGACGAAACGEADPDTLTTNIADTAPIHTHFIEDLPLRAA
jgi:hypothetical protein